MLIAAKGQRRRTELAAPFSPVRSVTSSAGMNARMQQVNFEVGDWGGQRGYPHGLTRRDLLVKELRLLALKKAQTCKRDWKCCTIRTDQSTSS